MFSDVSDDAAIVSRNTYNAICDIPGKPGPVLHWVPEEEERREHGRLFQLYPDDSKYAPSGFQVFLHHSYEELFGRSVEFRVLPPDEVPILEEVIIDEMCYARCKPWGDHMAVGLRQLMSGCIVHKKEPRSVATGRLNAHFVVQGMGPTMFERDGTCAGRMGFVTEIKLAKE